MKSILPINLTFDRVVGNLAQLPFDEGIEIAVCGRSNSGKSSIINALGNNKKLAKTSKKPGRTQTVNFFTINDDPQTKLDEMMGAGAAGAPTNNVGDGKIAGTVEAGDDPPVRKKPWNKGKKYLKGPGRKTWM